MYHNLNYFSNDCKVVVIIFTHSNNCSSVITKGGAKRIILPCVGLASNPLSLNFKQIFQAVWLSSVSLIKIAFNKPLPRTNVQILEVAIYFFNSSRKSLPKRSAFSANFS